MGEGLAQVISMHEMLTNQIPSCWIQLHADAAIESTCKPHVMVPLWKNWEAVLAAHLSALTDAVDFRIQQLGFGYNN